MRKIVAGAALALALVCGSAEANQSNTWSPTTGTVSGLQLTTNYNNAFSALQSCNSGATAPTNDQSAAAVKGQCWLNTSTTPNTVEMYDGANWVTIGWLDTTNHQWIANDAGGTGTIASNTTTDLGSVRNQVVTISGTTTITSFGTTALTGARYFVTFSGVLTLTNNGTSLILPNGGSNITTAAGDSLIAVALGSGNWQVVAYQAANGSALSANSNLTSSVALTGIIAPAALASGNTSDYNPTGLAGAETLQLTPNSSNSNLNGLAGGVTGRQITIVNVGTAILSLANNADATPANSFLTGRGYVNIYPGQSALLRYDGTASRWRVVSAPASADPLAQSFTNLKITNDSGAPTTTMDVTADDLVLKNPTTQQSIRAASYFPGVNVAPVMTASGANGLDTGSIINNTITWYGVYVIYNPTTNVIAGMYSLASSCNSGGVTMPSGYTYCARVGWVRTDGAATARWMRSQQNGRRFQYVVTAATNTLNLPNISNGTVGTYSLTAPTYVSTSVSSFVPSTASRIILALATTYKNNAGAVTLVAPNTSYSGPNEATNGNFPPCVNEAAANGQVVMCEFALESTNIAITANGSGAATSIVGYEDNLKRNDLYASEMLDVANDNDEITYKPARRANESWKH